MADAKYQLIQSAKDLRAQADQEKIAMAKVKQQLDQLNNNTSTDHTFGVAPTGSENAMNQLDRQVRDMAKDIDNLEVQARGLDKQARAL